MRTLQRCLDLCNQDSSLQPWAFDLPPSTAGGAAAPKRYVAARAMDFSSAYMALPQEQRHAYEIVRKSKPCWAFFDLERLECTGEANACAREIARVASGLLIERALELLGRAVSVQVLALDSSRERRSQSRRERRSHACESRLRAVSASPPPWRDSYSAINVSAAVCECTCCASNLCNNFV